MMKSILLNSLIFILLLAAACSERSNTVIAEFDNTTEKHAWAVKDLNPDLPSDWSSFGFLTFDMSSTSTQRFGLILYDAGGTRRITLHPFQGARVRVSIPLIYFQKRNTKGAGMAAINQTGRPGCWIGFTRSVGPIRQIDSLGVEMILPIGSSSVEFSNLKLTMSPEDSILAPIPLVDEFGQWIPADWPEKASSLAELENAWEEEENALKPGKFNVSKYGGFLRSRVEATGFFHTEKIEDKWWLVDPEGYLFFSTGSCVINTGGSLSRVSGREYVFKELPPAEELSNPNVRGRRGRAPSFYTWNLYRRYGSDWYQEWMDLTVLRMDSWGINTIANWSDPHLGSSRGKPYVATLGGWGIQEGIMGMPDVYVPDFYEKVDAAAARQCAHRKDDPYLIGYFIGNEQPWPHRESELINEILNGEDRPIKAALTAYLAEEDSPERREAFLYETHSRFLSTVNAAIKRHDPNHLNLGIRYGGGSPPDKIIRASTGFDVFSMNIYGYETDEKLKRVSDLIDLPIIIGEFHFGTPGRGLAPGLRQTRNQEERAAAYRYYVENAAAHPALVGTHWFQWIDQAPTGRHDGENYNIGFLDITDRPYPEMIKAARATFKRLHDVHSGNVPPVSRQAKTQ